MDPSMTRCTPRTVSSNVTPSPDIAKRTSKCGGDAHAEEHLKCTKCHSFPYIEVLNPVKSKKYKAYCLERHYLDDPAELVRQLKDRPDMIKYTTGDTSDDSQDSEEDEQINCSQKK
jgi:hypothetical protein